jgi:hydroxymethylpyrimidine/phosphomethylpyrimidine kinase
VDVLDDGLPDCTRYASPRIAARVRGTGCALASCIATYVAAGNELAVAVDRARRRVAAAMAIAQHAGETRLFSSETCTAEAVTLS